MTLERSLPRRIAGASAIFAVASSAGLGIAVAVDSIKLFSMMVPTHLFTFTGAVVGLVCGVVFGGGLMPSGVWGRPGRILGGLAGLGVIPVALSLARPYALDTFAIAWADGLRLRGVVPIQMLIVPGLALWILGAIVGTIWAVKAYRERAAEMAAKGPSGRRPIVSREQLLGFGVAVAASVVAYLASPEFRGWVHAALTILAKGDVSAVRDYLLGFGPWAPVVSSALMVLQSVVAPLPAFVITFANGMMFGWLWGALLSWSSAMAGAALCFYIARFAGRPVVEKLAGGSKPLEVSDLFFEKYGDRTVLIARLLPFVSFDIISYGAGLTSMGFWRFFIATGVGQLPATLVYSYLGQNLTGGVQVLFGIFTITTVIFVVIATLRPWFMRRLETRRAASAAQERGSDA